MWIKKGTAKDPKHTASVKHGGGDVMAWPCMTVSGTGPLYYTDDLMYDDCSRMNLEGYKTILTTNIQENATRFIGSSVKEFIRAKKWKVLDCPSQSLDLNQIEQEFHPLKRRVKAETIGIGCIRGWGKYFKWCLSVTDSLLWLYARDLQLNNSF